MVKPRETPTSLARRLLPRRLVQRRRMTLRLVVPLTPKLLDVSYVALDQGYIDDDGCFRAIYDQADKTAMISSGLLRYLRFQRS